MEKKKLEQLYKQKIYSIDEVMYNKVLNNGGQNNFFNVLVKINNIKEIRTKKNELMCFLTVTSGETYDVTVFSDSYIKYSNKLNDSINQYVLCEVSINNDKLILKRM